MPLGQIDRILPDQSRQQAVFEQLRQAILAGTFVPGCRLPPTRAMAEECGVARQTVVLAYERLAAEGYVRARVGSGTFVATDLPDAAPRAVPVPRSAAPALSRRGTALAAIPSHAAEIGDLGPVAGGSQLLAPGIPAPELFPAAAWARAAARALRAAPPGLTGYPDPLGLPALRVEIAAHLAATRGVVAPAERIVVTAGTQQALRIAAELVLDPGDAAWVEDPGYIAGRGALRAAGAILCPVPSDTEGIDVVAGIALAPDARLALVAPSHATPLGGALPIGRRLALLDWAARAGAWLLEDDCDSEFRWEGKPLPPLASLDQAGRVIYCGTFSKTLAPALRLGFAVLPAPLIAAFARARTLGDRGPPVLTQASLAAFMQARLLAPHIRRMRTEYARRRTALLAALARHCPGVQPVAAPGGLHMVLFLPGGADDMEVARRARASGLAVLPLRAYYAGTPRQPGLVIGFAVTPAALAADAARRLRAALA
jgi:GntR family transcriptional regulator/MocR family aminotransferase